MALNLNETQLSGFTLALDMLEQAIPSSKKLYQQQVLLEAERLLEEQNGLDILLTFAKRFEHAGVFDGGPWSNPSKLQPRLVSGTLMADDLTPVIEIMSELRMVSLAKNQHQNEHFSAEEAKRFLQEVMALNIDILFPEETEAARIEGKGKQKDRAVRLFQFLADKLSLASVSGTLVKEIQDILVQRPIMIKRVEQMIKNAGPLLEEKIDEKDRKKIKQFLKAISCPTSGCKDHPKYIAYRKYVKSLSEAELKEEAQTFAKSMEQTGLVAPYHTILVRHLNRTKPKLLSFALGLNNKGKANLEEHLDFIKQLIKVAIHPPLKQTLFGLKRILERGVLSSPPVIPGLRRLIELDLKPEVRNVLLNSIEKNEGITANDILTAGTISVLGQPMGVGQGMNPTCQTARGISLWSLHAPGYLLELIPRAARDGDVDIMFEGQEIHSKHLQAGLVDELHKDLDPVSLVLVPHLDRIYGELCRRVEFRGEDVHKWVNPAFYGHWVPRGFSSCRDPHTGTISDYAGFVRLFYSTHHPEHNEGYELIYPNPVGIFVTNSFSKLLGLHAISIQRIASNKQGEYRVYFYNPNNDSSQDWGQGIKPSVTGHGEEPGESSLPFHEFVSRLYAFHYNPYEQGDPFSVENSTVQKVEKLARNSWGTEYTWT